MSLPVLETPRLVLKSPLGHVTAAQLVDLFACLEQGRHMAAVPHPYGLEQAQGFLDFLEYVKNDPAHLQLGMFDKASHEFLGMMTLEDIDLDVGSAELGYWLARSHWKKGFAREAALRLLEHAFTERGLQRVYAFLSPENHASQRLLESFGFVVEGRLRRHRINKGVPVDQMVMGCLKEEWEVVAKQMAASGAPSSGD